MGNGLASLSAERNKSETKTTVFYKTGNLGPETRIEKEKKKKKRQMSTRSLRKNKIPRAHTCTHGHNGHTELLSGQELHLDLFLPSCTGEK